MRMVLRVLALLATLLVGGGLVLLLPPHVQIRGIEPPLPTATDLRALLTAPGGPRRVRYLGTAVQTFGDRRLGHTAALVEWDDGRTFLIDAGMDQQATIDFEELIEPMWGPGETTWAGSVADILGADVARVAGIGFTHLHIDHTQGLGALCERRGPGARLYRTRWQGEEHNLHTTEGADIVASSCLEQTPLLGDGLQTVAAFPGLGIVALGGHTPGSTLFAVAVDDHVWLFSGDITNTRDAILADEDKPFFYSYLVVPEHTAWTRTLRTWLRALDAEADMTVVVSHDIEALEASGLPAYVRK